MGPDTTRKDFNAVLSLIGQPASKAVDADTFWEKAVNQEKSFDPASLTDKERTTYNHIARLILPYLQQQDKSKKTTNIYSLEMKHIIELVLSYMPISDFLIDTSLTIAAKNTINPDSELNNSVPEIPDWLNRNVMELIHNKMSDSTKQAIINSNKRVLMHALQNRNTDDISESQLDLPELDQLSAGLLIPITTGIYILYNKLKRRLEKARRIEATQAEIGLHIVKPLWNRIHELYSRMVVKKNHSIIEAKNHLKVTTQDNISHKELGSDERSFALNILLLTTALYSRQEQIPANKFESLLGTLDDQNRKEFLEKYDNPYLTIGDSERYVQRNVYIDLVGKLLNQESSSLHNNPKLKILDDEISLLVEDRYIDQDILTLARTDEQEKLKNIFDTFKKNKYQLLTR